MLFYDIVEDIISHPEFIKTKNIEHHGKYNSVYHHSIAVANFAFEFSRSLKLKNEIVVDITRAALLHDFFGYDRKDYTCNKYSNSKKNRKGIRRFTHMHPFMHGDMAAKNAAVYFNLSERQSDAIVKHMFPVSPFPPMYTEGWIVTYADKMVSIKEMFFVPFVYLRGAIQKY